MLNPILGLPFPADGGPWYAETDFSGFPVEPWNAWSSLTFWIPALYWLWQIYHTKTSHRFLTYSCLLLLIGGLGSCLYHAFRSYPLLLAMDVAPIALLTLSVSIHFWKQLLKNNWLPFVLAACVMALRFVLFRFWKGDTQTAINFSYFISGTFMLLPVLLLMIRTKGWGWKNFAGTLLFLLLALMCRALDEEATPYISVGIHWLWHSFTAVAAWFLGNYLFTSKEQKIFE